MKKKIIGFMGVALFAAGLYVNQAQGASLQSVQKNYNEAVTIACDAAQDLAYNIMIVRQMPITEDEQIQMIKDIGVDPKAEENAIQMVKDAHAQPMVEDKFTRITARAFGYKIKEQCLKDMTGAVL